MERNKNVFIEQIQNQILNFESSFNNRVTEIGQRYQTMSNDCKSCNGFFKDVAIRLEALKNYGKNLIEISRNVTEKWSEMERERDQRLQSIKDQKRPLTKKLSVLNTKLEQLEMSISEVNIIKRKQQRAFARFQDEEKQLQLKEMSLSQKPKVPDINELRKYIQDMKQLLQIREQEITNVEMSLDRLQMKNSLLKAFNGATSRKNILNQREIEIDSSMETVKRKMRLIDEQQSTKRNIIEKLRKGKCVLTKLNKKRTRVCEARKQLKEEEEKVYSTLTAVNKQIEDRKDEINELSREIENAEVEYDQLNRSLELTVQAIGDWENDPVHIDCAYAERELQQLYKRIETEQSIESSLFKTSLKEEIDRSNDSPSKVNSTWAEIFEQGQTVLRNEIANVQQTLMPLQESIEKLGNRQTMKLAEKQQLTTAINDQQRKQDHYSKKSRNLTKVDHSHLWIELQDMKSSINDRKAQIEDRRLRLYQKQVRFIRLTFDRDYNSKFDPSDLAPAYIRTLSKIKSLRLVCDAYDSITKMFRDEHEKCELLPQKQITGSLEEWNTRLDSIYAKIDNKLIRARAYLLMK